MPVNLIVLFSLDCLSPEVLCDLPYGRQYGSEGVAGLQRPSVSVFEENHELYALALLDIARILKPRGRRVGSSLVSTPLKDSLHFN